GLHGPRGQDDGPCRRHRVRLGRHRPGQEGGPGEGRRPGRQDAVRDRPPHAGDHAVALTSGVRAPRTPVRRGLPLARRVARKRKRLINRAGAARQPSAGRKRVRKSRVVTAILDQLRTAPRSVLGKLPGVASDDDGSRRPLPVSGMLAAAMTLGAGLAVLTTLTLVGWMAAPRGALGQGMPGVFRTAAQIWLAAHHAGFEIPGGRVGLLPLGLMVLPALLLYKAGRWMARDADLRVRLPARLPKNSPKEKANARRRAQLVLVVQAGV